MDKGIPVFFRQLIGMGTGLVIDVPVKHNLRPVAFGMVYFNQGGGGGHHNHRFGIVTLGGIGHALGMVSRGGRNQPLGPLLL